MRLGRIFFHHQRPTFKNPLKFPARVLFCLFQFYHPVVDGLINPMFEPILSSSLGTLDFVGDESPTNLNLKTCTLQALPSYSWRHLLYILWEKLDFLSCQQPAPKVLHRGKLHVFSVFTVNIQEDAEKHQKASPYISADKHRRLEKNWRV